MTVFFFSCNRLENKAKQLGDKTKSKSKQLIDTVISKVLPDQHHDLFSIRSIVKDFQNDKSITEIKGIQTDQNFMYVEYCVYKGQKSRVLKGVNAIVPIKVNDYISDNKCYSVTKETLYKSISPDEKGKGTAFFWNFEKLAKYDVYTCVKAPLRHYIIFDKSSDTVYHRIEEIRD